MILTVNIGNTHITVGGYEQDTLIFCGRLHSDPAATVEEYAIRLVNLLQLSEHPRRRSRAAFWAVWCPCSAGGCWRPYSFYAGHAS